MFYVTEQAIKRIFSLDVKYVALKSKVIRAAAMQVLSGVEQSSKVLGNWEFPRISSPKTEQSHKGKDSKFQALTEFGKN